MWMTDEELEELWASRERRKAEDERAYKSFPAWLKVLIWLIALSPFIWGAIVLIVKGLKEDGIIAP